MDPKMKALLAIAASVAGGCASCLETHIVEARQAGADTREIQTAVNIARAIRLQAVTAMDDLASQWTAREVIAVLSDSAGCGPGCHC